MLNRKILLISFAVAAILILAVLVNVSRKPGAIPDDRQAFIGKWKSSTGFELEIAKNGTASIFNDNSGTPHLSIPVAPDRNIGGFRVKFDSDSTFDIVRPGYYGKSYHIDLDPGLDDSGNMMILNGVALYRQP